MKMVDWFKRIVSGHDKTAVTELRHELKNSIQAVQSGNRIVKPYSGMIEINNKRGPRT